MPRRSKDAFLVAADVLRQEGFEDEAEVVEGWYKGMQEFEERAGRLFLRKFEAGLPEIRKRVKEAMASAGWDPDEDSLREFVTYLDEDSFSNNLREFGYVPEPDMVAAAYEPIWVHVYEVLHDRFEDLLWDLLDE